MKKIIEYDVVFGEGLNPTSKARFARTVDERLDKGYEIHGGLKLTPSGNSSKSIGYAQVMVKYEKEECSDDEKCAADEMLYGSEDDMFGPDANPF